MYYHNLFKVMQFYRIKEMEWAKHAMFKSEYYSSIIKENSGNQKVLFKTVQKLLQKPTVNYYPPSKNDRMLAGEFATFFTTKIDTPHNDLLVKKKLLFTLVIVSLMRYSQCLRLNFKILLR